MREQRVCEGGKGTGRGGRKEHVKEQGGGGNGKDEKKEGSG